MSVQCRDFITNDFVPFGWLLLGLIIPKAGRPLGTFDRTRSVKPDEHFMQTSQRSRSGSLKALPVKALSVNRSAGRNRVPSAKPKGLASGQWD